MRLLHRRLLLLCLLSRLLLLRARWKAHVRLILRQEGSRLPLVLLC